MRKEEAEAKCGFFSRANLGRFSWASRVNSSFLYIHTNTKRVFLLVIRGERDSSLTTPRRNFSSL
jgi:hypothetical protein